MKIKPIKTEDDYDQVLKRIDELIDCEENPSEEAELEIISLLVWDYEEKHYKIDQLQPIEAIQPG